MTARIRTIALQTTAGLALACTAATLFAAAPAYPARSIRMILPWPPSGAVDILARPVSQRLSESLGQPIVIDNRPGANGILGSELAAKSPPDGYTLLIDNVTGHAINATLYRKMPYNTQRDFTHLSLLAWVANGIAVLPSLPARNVKELIALGRARPGQLTYASFGVGSSAHLAGELFKKMAKVDMLHVPYKGGLPAIQDLLGGQVAMYFPVLPSVVALHKAGRLRILAATGSKRTAALPDIPTVAESGLAGFEATNWFGMMAPAGLPPEVTARMNAEVHKILQLADVRERLSVLAYDLQASTPQEFSEVLRSETEKWAAVVKESGARLE